MIPAYNCAKYLRQTLESVLAQDPGSEQMQIEVVDDCSTKDDPEAVVRKVGKERVAYYRKPRNEGATANFNTCLKRSRGHLIHILNGDSYVLPEFYAKVANLAKSHPMVSVFFVRSRLDDEKGALKRISDRYEKLAKPSNSPDDLLYNNDMMISGVVIRRSFYEKQGGFRPELLHAADWEMWVRAITNGRGLFLNELLSTSRLYYSRDSGKLARTADNLRNRLQLMDFFALSYDNFEPARFRESVARCALEQEKFFMEHGDKDAAASNHKLWRELSIWPLRLEDDLGFISPPLDDPSLEGRISM